MTSSVYFKYSHAKEPEPIFFTGNQIKVLDLKRSIVDMKNLKGGMDFDFKINDAENASTFFNDEDHIPKNTTLIVKRIAVNGPGLLSRLSGKSAKPAFNGIPTKIEKPIVIPAKPDIEQKNETTDIAPAPSSTEDEELRRLQELTSKNQNYRNTIKNRYVIEDPNASVTSTNKNASVAQQHQRRPVPPNYECYRCGRGGHNIKDCPTNGDPAYDIPKEQRRVYNNVGPGQPGGKLAGVPVSNIKYVDESGNAIDNNAGRKDVNSNSNSVGIEVLEPSVSAYKRVLNMGATSASVEDINLSSVPSNLKCVLSGKILRDAVITPCCQRTASGIAMREALLQSTQLQCPLCRAFNVSPDALNPLDDLRREVEEYIANIKSGNNASSSVNNSDISSNNNNPPNINSESDIANSNVLPFVKPPPPPPHTMPPAPLNVNSGAGMPPSGPWIEAPPMQNRGPMMFDVSPPLGMHHGPPNAGPWMMHDVPPPMNMMMDHPPGYMHGPQDVMYHHMSAPVMNGMQPFYPPENHMIPPMRGMMYPHPAEMWQGGGMMPPMAQGGGGMHGNNGPSVHRNMLPIWERQPLSREAFERERQYQRSMQRRRREREQSSQSKGKNYENISRKRRSVSPPATSSPNSNQIASRDRSNSRERRRSRSNGKISRTKNRERSSDRSSRRESSNDRKEKRNENSYERRDRRERSYERNDRVAKSPERKEKRERSPDGRDRRGKSSDRKDRFDQGAENRDRNSDRKDSTKEGKSPDRRDRGDRGKEDGFRLRDKDNYDASSAKDHRDSKQRNRNDVDGSDANNSKSSHRNGIRSDDNRKSSANSKSSTNEYDHSSNSDRTAPTGRTVVYDNPSTSRSDRDSNSKRSKDNRNEDNYRRVENVDNTKRKDDDNNNIKRKRSSDTENNSKRYENKDEIIVDHKRHKDDRNHNSKSRSKAFHNNNETDDRWTMPGAVHNGNDSF